MRLSIEQEILEKALNYIATKPFVEVAQIIADVQKDIKLIEEQKEEPSE